MKNILKFGLIAVLGCCLVSAAHASTIFTNLSTPGGTFNTSTAFNVTGTGWGGRADAMPFTAGATADLTDAILALGHDIGSNDAITVDLESDGSDGLPGAILATLTQQGAIPSAGSPGLVTFDCSASCPLLNDGTTYWLVAAETNPSTYQSWFFSTNSDTGAYAGNSSASATGPWSAATTTSDAAFEIDGTPAAAPEPSSVVLLGVVLLGFLVVGRRFRCA
ncbi:MAG: choice-of-anchor R domain-containing protein [Terriglobia bacterium]